MVGSRFRRIFRCPGSSSLPEPHNNNTASYDDTYNTNPAYSSYTPPTGDSKASYNGNPAPDAKPYSSPFSEPFGGPPPPTGPPPPFESLPPSDNELPPPPAFHELHLDSPASNAEGDMADLGWAFTQQHPVSGPRQYSAHTLASIADGDFYLAPQPAHFRGMLTHTKRFESMITTAPGCPDTCLISNLPVYAAGYHYPANTGAEKRAYYEILVEAMPADSAVAIGYAAVPYPCFRLPGWNRGSLAVHGDDGRRYVNDSFGGRDCMEPFRTGDKIGLGMKWGATATDGIEIVVFRNGRKETSWRLDEVRDGKDERDALSGLDGITDVYAAIGVWGGGVRVRINWRGERNMPAF